MANKKVIVTLGVGVLALGVVCTLSMTKNAPIFGMYADEKTYSVTLDNSNATTLKATSTGGSNFQFIAEGLTAVEGKLGKLTKDGYITLDEGYSLNNLKSFSVNSDDHEAFKVSYGFEEGQWVREDLEGWVPSTAGEQSLLNEHPNYIKLTASKDVTIDSVSFTYTTDGASCVTPTATPTGYKGTTWHIVGTHQGWNASAASTLKLNTKNPDTSVFEYSEKIDFDGSGEFKIINGSDWTSFNNLSVSTTEKAKDNLVIPDIVPNDRANIKVNKMGTYTFYVKLGEENSVSVTIDYEAPKNPVDINSQTTTVYFVKPDNYGSTVNAYIWDNYDNTYSAWPGTAMTLVEDNLYSIEYNTDYYTNVIFNDGTNQTADLTSPTDENVKYVIGAGWVPLDYEEEIVTTLNIYVDVTTAGWTKVNSYKWGGSKTNDNWPGVAATKVSGYIYMVSAFEVGEHINIIFNNGSQQTVDLELPDKGGTYLYTLGSMSGGKYTASYDTYTPQA